MKKLSLLTLCAIIVLTLTACGRTETYADSESSQITNVKENQMLKPEIKICDSVITLPCALKCIENAVIDEDYVSEFNYDGIDAIHARINYNGYMVASVTLDNRDKDLPIEEKTIVEIMPFDGELCGIRWQSTKWEDACAISGCLDFVKFGNFLAPLENGYYLDCHRDYDNGTISEMTIYTCFDNASDMERVLSEMKQLAKKHSKFY